MEDIRQIIAWEMLFILVFAALLVIDSTESSNFTAVTGRVVQGASQQSILADLEAALPNAAMFSDISDINMCVIVNVDSTTRYSYDVVKIAGVTAVTPSDNWMCNGVSQEDFIFSYVDYNKFAEHAANPPTFADLRRTSDGTNFYIYPSKYILPGLIVTNAKEFDKKFGSAIKKYFTAKEVRDMLNPKTLTPGAITFSLSYLIYIIGGLVVAVVVIVLFVFTHQKQPEVKENLELSAFVKSAFAQGYTEEQVMQALAANGWSQEQIKGAIVSMNTEAPGPAEASQN